MYLFSPYDVERIYGQPFADISVSDKYQEMVDDARIRKTKINAREFFQTLAELQFESGYPYILFEDTANKANPIAGRINMSNLCVTGDSEILTDRGYRSVKELYDTQEDFQVVVDKRARDMDLKATGVAVEPSTRMFLTAENADVYKLTTAEGFELRATEWHKMYIVRDGELMKVSLSEVEAGDRILVQPQEGAFGNVHFPDLAYLAGGIAADGTFATGPISISARLYLYGEKAEFRAAYEAAATAALAGRGDLVERQATLTPVFTYASAHDRHTLSSAPLAKLLAEYGFTSDTKTQIPEFVLRGDEATQRAYLTGLFQLDGTITSSATSGGASIELGSIDRDHLVQVQRILLNFGAYTRIYRGRREAGTTLLPNGRDGYSEYAQQPTWSLRATTQTDVDILAELVTTWRDSHVARLAAIQANRSDKAPYRTHRHTATVIDITFDGIEDVYDVTVDNGHSVIFNGIATGNCSEILQVNTPSTLNEDLTYSEIGRDISCNLGSMNIAAAMDGGNLAGTVETAIRALTAVSQASNIQAVPSVANGNDKSHAIGLGQMNLHGYLARERIHYGSPEALDFTNMYFYTIAYHAIAASNRLAKETGERFAGFEDSTYATGEYFTKYIEQEWAPATKKTAKLFADAGITIPTQEDWAKLARSVKKYGIYNAYLQAVPPTGSISYINHSTSSIHPIASKIEIRKEGRLGRVYYPAPFMTNDNLEYYTDAYEIGPDAIIDTYAAATQHVDQRLSLTLFFKDTATTRDINKAQIYAWRKGIKTIYYIRLRQLALEGTEIDTCVSCAL